MPNALTSPQFLVHNPSQTLHEAIWHLVIRAAFWALRHDAAGLREVRRMGEARFWSIEHGRMHARAGSAASDQGLRESADPLVANQVEPARTDPDVYNEPWSHEEIARLEALVAICAQFHRPQLDQLAERHGARIDALPGVAELIDTHRDLLGALAAPLRILATDQLAPIRCVPTGPDERLAHPRVVAVFTIDQWPITPTLERWFPIDPRVRKMPAWFFDHQAFEEDIYGALPEQELDVDYESLFVHLRYLGWYGGTRPFRYGRRGAGVSKYRVMFGCHSSATPQQVREYFRSIDCLVIDAADVVRTCEAWYSAHQHEPTEYAGWWRVYGALHGWPIDPVAAQLRDGGVEAVVKLALHSRELSAGWTWLLHLADAIGTSAEVRARLGAAGLTRDDLQRWNDQLERIYNLIYSGKKTVHPAPVTMECAPWPVGRSPKVPTDDPQRRAEIARVLHESFPTAIGDDRFVLRKVWDDLRAVVETYRLDEQRRKVDSREIYTQLADPHELDVEALVQSLGARLVELARSTPDEIALLAGHEVGLVPFGRPRPAPPELAQVVEREFRVEVEEWEEVANAAMVDADGALRVVRLRRRLERPDDEYRDRLSMIVLSADEVATLDEQTVAARIAAVAPRVTITALEGRLDGDSEADGDALNDPDDAFWQGWDEEDDI